jgi:hypothetical protein
VIRSGKESSRAEDFFSDLLDKEILEMVGMLLLVLTSAWVLARPVTIDEAIVPHPTKPNETGSNSLLLLAMFFVTAFLVTDGLEDAMNGAGVNKDNFWRPKDDVLMGATKDDRAWLMMANIARTDTILLRQTEASISHPFCLIAAAR